MAGSFDGSEKPIADLRAVMNITLAGSTGSISAFGFTTDVEVDGVQSVGRTKRRQLDAYARATRAGCELSLGCPSGPGRVARLQRSSGGPGERAQECPAHAA
jgi:hypothetical protein